MRPRSLLNVVRGFAMGAADIVPGVSGGTIALVLGIYERLIDSIHEGASGLGRIAKGDLLGASGALRRVDWPFVVTLLLGIGAAVVSLASVIEHLLETRPERMAGLFFGLIVGSAVVSFRLVRRVDASRVALAGAVGLVMFLALGLRADTEASGAEVVTEPLWAFFLAGALAICAMILPGVSGSFILVMIGMYTEVLGAVNDRDPVPIAALLLGCVIGLAAFSTLLKYLLDRHHDLVIAAMIGLMVGSLRVLWPWPDGTASTRLEAPSGDVAVALLLAVLGFAAVVVVDLVGTRASAGSTLERVRPSG